MDRRDPPDSPNFDQFTLQLQPLIGLLRPWLLPSAERYRRFGRLGRGADALVQCVADALQEHPGVFPELPSGEALRARQCRAYDLKRLHLTLRTLSDWAFQAYVHEQSDLVDLSIEALRQCQHTYDPEQREQRARALEVPFAVAARLRWLRGRKPSRKPARRSIKNTGYGGWSAALQAAFLRAFEERKKVVPR